MMPASGQEWIAWGSVAAPLVVLAWSAWRMFPIGKKKKYFVGSMKGKL